MSSREAYVPIPGTERVPLADDVPQAEAVEAVSSERIQVTVVLHSKRSGAERDAALEASTRASGERTYLSREELGSQHGADPADVAKIEAFATENGLSVVESDPARRMVILSGTVAAMSDAFKVELTHYHSAWGSFRGRSGPVMVPTSLAPVIQTVTGLDNRPQVRPRFRRLETSLSRGAHPRAGSTSYTPVQIAQLYSFPSGVDGSGQCIGILEFGGGFSITDLQTYFRQLGMSVPSVTVVSVDGAQNLPSGDPSGADGEVFLDIEVAGAIAPKARIVVYFAPNTSQGFVDAVQAAIHDTTNQPSVISISWGGPEATWTSATMQAMDQAFQDAALVGVTVFCAAGDNGSGDGMRRGTHVDFPASSPNASGCGGTELGGSGNAIGGEVVWNDPGHGATGGGVSTEFPRPVWQMDVNVPSLPTNSGGRGVPDVAGDASPLTGYQVLVDGQHTVFGGTSAVAPLWAGLIALVNQQKGTPVGFLNSLIYHLPTGTPAFHDITDGTNGAYRAGPGWDPCTGLGSPDGGELAKALVPSPER